MRQHLYGFGAVLVGAFMIFYLFAVLPHSRAFEFRCYGPGWEFARTADGFVCMKATLK